MNCKVLYSLYFRCAGTDEYGRKMSWARSKINRTFYHITDLELWFSSDFEEGCELDVHRVSSDAKYGFYKHMGYDI